MNDFCDRCHRPTNPSYDRIESLLVSGVPPKPDSRATKSELRQEIESLRSLLADLRVTLLQAYATEIDLRSDRQQDRL